MFRANDRIRVSDDFFWAKGGTGTVSEPPAEVTALSGPWEGNLTRRSDLGKRTQPFVDCVNFHTDAVSAALRSCGSGTFTTAIPAALAAVTPTSASSNTRHSSGFTPNIRAAVRKGSGSGLPFA